MKLWIGAETQADVVDLFRSVRKDVEGAVNASIGPLVSDIGVESWDCIVILRDDADFKEITKVSKARRDMDFRLKLDYQEFVQADDLGRRKLLVHLLLRSLELLQAKVGQQQAIQELVTCVQATARRHEWL